MTGPYLPSVDDAYAGPAGLLARLLGRPPGPAPRGFPTREDLNGQFWFRADRPAIAAPGRDLNYRFMVAEFVWMLFGLDDVSVLARYNSKMADYSDDGLVLAGAYGPRIARHLPYVVRTLTQDPDSRQAVIPIFDDRATRPSKDVPCTLSLGFYLREGEVHVTAFMRSSDAWLGIPYDAFSFAMIGHVVAAAIGARPGSVCITAGSQHMYDRDRAAVEAFVGTYQSVPSFAASAAPLVVDAAPSGMLSLPWALLETLKRPEDGARWRKYLAPCWQGLADVLVAKSKADARTILTRLSDR